MVYFPQSWAQPLLKSSWSLSLSLFFGTHMGERMQSSQPLQSPADLFLFFGTHMGERMQSSQPLQSPADLSLSLLWHPHGGEDAILTSTSILWQTRDNLKLHFLASAWLKKLTESKVLQMTSKSSILFSFFMKNEKKKVKNPL
jgi:hypothetical protein